MKMAVHKNSMTGRPGIPWWALVVEFDDEFGTDDDATAVVVTKSRTTTAADHGLAAHGAYDDILARDETGFELSNDIIKRETALVMKRDQLAGRNSDYQVCYRLNFFSCIEGSKLCNGQSEKRRPDAV